MRKKSSLEIRRKRRLRRLKSSLLPSLSRDQRRIIYLRFWESCTIEKISEEMKLSWDEVDQIIESTLIQLRNQLEQFETD